VLVIGSVVSILCSVGLISALAQSDSAPPRAKFNDDGTVNVPLGYRNWTHVGTRHAKRFPNATGHWGYFSFGHRPPPYDKTATVRDKQQCESCHINLASDTDYVISRAHIGLTGRVEKDR
jgi:hypothetical protein